MYLPAIAASGVISLRGLAIALPLAGIVLLLGWLFARQQKKRAKKPGRLLRYTVPGQTAAACRGLLGTPAPQDIFTYTLHSAPNGGWYWNLKQHNPTGQPLDTLYLLQLEGDAPAVLCLTFVREAFGMGEPVVGEALLDDFFAQKLAAVRLPAAEE